jgi:hypothetical protein
VARLLYGFDNSLDVKGLDGAQVEDFGFNAVFGFELFGGGERLADAAREGYDGEVLAGALDLGFAELGLSVGLIWRAEGRTHGNDEVVLLGLLAHGERETVQKPVVVSSCLCGALEVAYSFSKTMTGLGSRIAALSRPFASSALYGQTTFRPGMLPYQAV